MIDVYQVHWPDPNTPIEETAAAMADLFTSGKIRAIGVSNFTPAQMDAFRTVAPLHTAQPPYNLFERAIDRDVLPYCHDRKMQGQWVRTSVKVNLTPAEKARIGKPSSPRPELDVVAYSGRKNVLTVVECKSYIDSVGVQASGFNGTNAKAASRYKLFNDEPCGGLF